MIWVTCEYWNENESENTVMTGLGQFVRKSTSAYSDSLKASDCANAGFPMLVRVNEYKTGLKTKHAPNGDGEGVSVDVINLRDNQVFVNVLWMGGAVRDQLRDYAGNGQFLPIKLVWATSDGGQAFVTPEALDGAELELAAQFVTNYPTYLDDTKNTRLAEWKAKQESAVGQAPAAPTFPALRGPAPAAPVVSPEPQPPAPAPAPAPLPQRSTAPAPQPVPPAPPVASVTAQPGAVSDADVDDLMRQL